MINTICVDCGNRMQLPDDGSSTNTPCSACGGPCATIGFTEQDWLEKSSVEAMLVYLLGKVSPRKLRLSSCAFCRRIAHLLVDPRSRDALIQAEKYADGDVSAFILQAAHHSAIAAADEARPNWEVALPAGVIISATSDYDRVPKAALHCAKSICDAASHVPGGHGNTEYAYQASTLHDIFGNPFRPVTLDSACLTSTVKLLAESIYQERTFDRLPILADALEDAGCTDAVILGHCRGPGLHVRGCWVVDLLTGRE